MTIAYFVRSLTNGGAEHVAAQLTILWSKLGFKVLVVSEQPPTKQDYPHQIVAREVAPLDILSPSRILDMHTQYRFDIAVFNDGCNASGFARILESVKAIPNMRTVLILHHSFMNWCFQLVCLRELSDGPRLLASFDFVVCVDPLSALWWRQAGARSVWIPNPVAIKPCEKCEYMPSHDIVWVGRVTDSGKRIGLMLDVFGRVHAKMPDSRLVILGAIEPTLERGLLRHFSCDVAKAVVFKGFVSDVSAELKRAGVHVLTSLVEAAPQVVAEAQAVGVPTVVYDLPVLCMENESSGVVKVAGEEDLAEALVSLLDDPERMQRLGQCAVETVKKRKYDLVGADKWRKIFACLKNHAELESFIEEEGYVLNSAELRQAMFEELRRGHQYLVGRYLPENLCLMKWRRRFNVRYVMQRMRNKFGKVLKWL